MVGLAEDLAFDGSLCVVSGPARLSTLDLENTRHESGPTQQHPKQYGWSGSGSDSELRLERSQW